MLLFVLLHWLKKLLECVYKHGTDEFIPLTSAPGCFIMTEIEQSDGVIGLLKIVPGASKPRRLNDSNILVLNGRNVLGIFKIANIFQTFRNLQGEAKVTVNGKVHYLSERDVFSVRKGKYFDYFMFLFI